ncbi:hypothetical protein EVA_02063, partial [gut metagenome]
GIGTHLNFLGIEMGGQTKQTKGKEAGSFHDDRILLLISVYKLGRLDLK